MAGFAELAARSHYSFVEGSASPRTQVAAARELGIEALGLCDRNGLYGAVGFLEAARKAGIRGVIGAELDLDDGDRLRLVARNRDGYRQLSRAISAAQLAGVNRQPRGAQRLRGDEETAHDDHEGTHADVRVCRRSQLAQHDVDTCVRGRGSDRKQRDWGQRVTQYERQSYQDDNQHEQTDAEAARVWRVGEEVLRGDLPGGDGEPGQGHERQEAPGDDECGTGEGQEAHGGQRS